VSAQGTFACFICVYPEDIFVVYRKMIEIKVGPLDLVTESPVIQRWTDKLFARSTNELAQNTVHRFYVGSDRQILAILTVEKISFTDKILTVLMHLYPYIENELSKYAVAMPYVAAEKEHGLDPSGYRERNAALADQTFICAITQIVFCSAYSKESMIEDQIYRRMIAALAKLQQEAIPKVTFSSTYNCPI
jgi:hypothetical protein